MQITVEVETLGKAMQMKREAAGKTIEEAAAHFETSARTIRRYEDDNLPRRRRRFVARRWAEWLGLDVDYFAELTEEEPPGQGFRASRWNRIPSQAAA